MSYEFPFPHQCYVLYETANHPVITMSPDNKRCYMHVFEQGIFYHWKSWVLEGQQNLSLPDVELVKDLDAESCLKMIDLEDPKEIRKTMDAADEQLYDGFLLWKTSTGKDFSDWHYKRSDIEREIEEWRDRNV